MHAVSGSRLNEADRRDRTVAELCAEGGEVLQMNRVLCGSEILERILIRYVRPAYAVLLGKPSPTDVLFRESIAYVGKIKGLSGGIRFLARSERRLYAKDEVVV